MKNKGKKLTKLVLKKETVVALTKAQASKVFGGNAPVNPDTLANTSAMTSGCGDGHH